MSGDSTSHVYLETSTSYIRSRSQKCVKQRLKLVSLCYVHVTPMSFPPQPVLAFCIPPVTIILNDTGGQQSSALNLKIRA